MAALSLLRAYGVHGKFDVNVEFNKDVTMLYGRNGCGKTTLMHIIANMLQGDVSRFAHLHFEAIEMVSEEQGLTRISKSFSNRRLFINVQRDSIDLDPIDITEIRNTDTSRDGRTSTLLARREREQLGRSEQMRESLGLDSVAYFPAFRTVIEAWADSELRQAQVPRTYMRERNYSPPIVESLFDPDMDILQLTRYARDLFGQFIPLLDYPTPAMIENKLSEDARSAEENVSIQTQEAFYEALADVFASLFVKGASSNERPDEVLDQIRSLLNELMLATNVGGDPNLIGSRMSEVLPKRLEGTVSESASRILNVFRSLLEEQVAMQGTYFRYIDDYINSVNIFLEGKELMRRRGADATGKTRVAIQPLQGGATTSLKMLSSGERQLVSMLYAASRIGQRQIVLIDEPEISLHVDWQRSLMSEMMGLLEGKQVIVCTHSPEIMADHRDKRRQLVPTPTAYPDSDAENQYEKVPRIGDAVLREIRRTTDGTYTDAVAYCAYLQLSGRRRLIVEGPSDKRVFEMILSELPINTSIATRIDVDAAADLPPVSDDDFGERAKVEHYSELITAQGVDDHVVCLADREFRGFDIESISDTIGDHKTSGRLVWTRGHSLENYCFDPQILRSAFRSHAPIKNLPQTESTFRNNFPSILRIAAALSLAAARGEQVEANFVINSIDWKYFLIDTSVEFDIDRWYRWMSTKKPSLALHLADLFRESYEISLDKPSELLRWISHGHIGMKVFWSAFIACAVYCNEGEQRVANEIASCGSDEHRSHACMSSWTESILRNETDDLRNILRLLKIE